MFTRDEIIGINYITPRQEIELDDSFIYVNSEPGADYFEFRNIRNSVEYIFRILLSESFPFAPPSLLLFSPKKVSGYQNDPPLNQLQCSHEFHLNGVTNDGLDICYASSFWKPNICVSVLILKAYLWCEAYVRYLNDGRCVDVHLHEMRQELER